jgi:transportin-3
MVNHAAPLPTGGAQQPPLLSLELPAHSNNVDEELHRIKLALDAVFTTVVVPSSSSLGHPQQQQHWWNQRQLADRYLTSFQGTSISWMVCDKLLQQNANAMNDRATRQCFFAAQTLHIKCRVDMQELPSSSLPSLRDSLLQHLSRYMLSRDEALTTRLAMCISALAVQMGWTSVVDDLLGTCREGIAHAPTNRTVALFILRVLPEECASDRLYLLDDNKRFEMRDHLVASAPLFFSFLLASLQDNRPEQISRVLKTFHLWIRYVPVHPSAIVESPLLKSSIQALTQSDYMELAADVVVEILRMYPSQHHANEMLVQAMIPALSKLPLEEALRSNDEDVLRSYCRVVTEMGESYMSLILDYHHDTIKEAGQIVDWVLRCSAITDSEIAGITLHFWYRMVMDLEGIEPFEYRQYLIDTYTPQLMKLIDCCVKCLMPYPSDVDEIAEDIVEDLSRHRSYVMETVEDCCRLLGGHNVLHRIGVVFQEQVANVIGQQSVKWHGLESCMSCISAVHRFIPADEEDILPVCFNLIPQFPTDIKPLRFAACALIGKFASWLAVHPDLMHALLPYLAQSLSVHECSSSAAIAIKELCKCSNHNFRIAEPVLQLYEEVSSHPGHLKLEDELHLLEGVCRAMSRIIQDTQSDGQAFLHRILHPIGNRLAANVRDMQSSARRITPDIDRLTVMVQSLVVPVPKLKPHPMIELLQSLWELLDTATKRFPDDSTLAEKICRLHKHTLRTCGAKAYAPMLDSLMQLLVRSFEHGRQSSFLYAASICITEFGRDGAYTQKLYEMIATFATTVFSFLRNLEEMTEHPDVVEEFFYLMARMISYCPDPIVSGPLLKPLFQCSSVALQLQHPGANRGTLRFLDSTLSFGLELRDQCKPEARASIENVISEEGQAIVSNLSRAMTDDIPAYNDQIPTILWKLNVLCPGLLNQWLSNAFASEVSLPESAKIDLMQALNSALARDEFSLAVHAFQSVCDRERRFRKMHARRG